jgi:extracellular matrix regulatory protein A
MSPSKLVNVGFGNMVVASRIIVIMAPSSAPMKRLKEEARQQGKLIDATQGRKTRALVITDSDHVILSAVQPITIAQRFDDQDAPEPNVSVELDDNEEDEE